MAYINNQLLPTIIMTESQADLDATIPQDPRRADDIALIQEWAQCYQEYTIVPLLHVQPLLVRQCLTVTLQHFLGINPLMETGNRVDRRALAQKIVAVIQANTEVTLPPDATEYLDSVTTWIVHNSSMLKERWNRFGYGRTDFLYWR